MPAPTCASDDVIHSHPNEVRRPKKVLHIFNGAGGGAALSTLALIGEFQKLGIDSLRGLRRRWFARRARATARRHGRPLDFHAALLVESQNSRGDVEAAASGIAAIDANRLDSPLRCE